MALFGQTGKRACRGSYGHWARFYSVAMTCGPFRA
jgi:hypothetical protein